MRSMLPGYDLICGGFETIPVSDTAIGFTASEIAPTTGTYKGFKCQMAEVTVVGDDIRYRLDGTDPTAGVGHIVDIDHVANPSVFQIWGEKNIENFMMIRTDAGDATASVSYYF